MRMLGLLAGRRGERNSTSDGMQRMKLQRRQIAGGACILGGTVAYLWPMAALVVPTAVELAANLGMPSHVPATWTWLTAAALLVVFGVDRVFSCRC